MYAYMGHIKYEDLKPYPDDYWTRMGISLRQDHAEGISEFGDSGNVVRLASGEVLAFDKLIIATGSRPNRFDWPGEHLRGVQGLYSIQDLEGLEASTPGIQNAVIVGGGLIGIEMAEMLRSRHINVTFLVREKSYMDYLLPEDESRMVGRHIGQFGIDIQYGTELVSINVGLGGSVESVTTSNGDEIDADFVGLTAGVHPNTSFAEVCGIETGRGVLVDQSFQTSRQGVYAIGDCAEFRESLPDGRSIEQLWYSGRRHGQALGRFLSGQDGQYQPGVFFNSAKFFELEYQTYGRIDAEPGPEYASVVWTSEAPERLLRIQYDAQTKAVVGLNVLGMRLRHEVCELWISEEADLNQVIDQIKEAGFDPEFASRLRIERTQTPAMI
jgi:NADH oxidase (H2O2-forming)